MWRSIRSVSIYFAIGVLSTGALSQIAEPVVFAAQSQCVLNKLVATLNPARASDLVERFRAMYQVEFADSFAGGTYEELGPMYRKIALDRGADLHGLSDDELVAIWGYSGLQYAPVNSALRSGRHLDRYAPYVEMLNSALSKLPDFKGTVFRGASLSADDLQLYEVGNIVSDRAFLSTSYEGFAEYRANNPQLFKIHSKHGKLIQPFQLNPDEREVLFRPGTLFKVLEKKNGAPTKFTLEEMD